MDWSATVTSLGPKLNQYFAMSGIANTDAEDMVQDTLIRLVHKVSSGQYDVNRANMQTFAYGIARYVRLEFFRKSRGVKEQLSDEVDEQVDEKIVSPYEQCDQNQKATILRQAILSLKPDEQEVIALMLDADLTINEIAQIMAIPEGTVKSHMHRAKQKIKKYILAKHNEE